jgi:putative colanic acid biosynthesis acetyltransferase WcaF
MRSPASPAALTAWRITRGDRLRRMLWSFSWLLLGRASPNALHPWRRWLVRAFGAQVGKGVHIYPGARIWAPWNLRMENRSCLANGVGCYNVAPIEIGEDAVISQDVYLCTATHDYNDPAFPLLIAPITIEARAWVAAGAFLSPGIIIHRGAVVGARSVVTANVPAWSVVAGNPARVIKSRVKFDSL